MIVDTNALSAWRDADASLLPYLGRTRRVVIPSIVIGEYLYGIVRSRERVQARAWLDDLLPTTRVGVIGLQTAIIYGATRANLREIGRPIPDNDIWIAALALEHRLPILSRDAHFDSVDGVTRIGW